MINSWIKASFCCLELKRPPRCVRSGTQLSGQTPDTVSWAVPISKSSWETDGERWHQKANGYDWFLSFILYLIFWLIFILICIPTWCRYWLVSFHVSPDSLGSDMASLMLLLHLLSPTTPWKRPKISPNDATDKMLYFYKVYMSLLYN